MEPAREPASLASCSNCGAILRGPWCSQCGQRASSQDPTWHDLVHDTTHEFLHLDGKIFFTIRRLFFEPGSLTAEHIRGRRARYIGPLRLYLTMSVIFFALAAVIPNPNPNPDSDPAPVSSAGANVPAKDSAVAGGDSETTLRARIGRGIRRARSQEEHFDETLSHTFQRMLFVLVPAFALLLKLGYRNGRHYPQFLYFALHFHAAVFGFLALTVPLQALTYEGPEKIAQALVLAGSFAYLAAAIKHVFGGTTLRTVLKAAALSAAYILLLAGASGIVILVIFYRLGAPPA